MAPLKSSLARSAAKLLGVFNQTDLSLRGGSQNTRHFIPPTLEATGGTKATFGGIVYHTFTSSGAFTITDDNGNSSIPVSILVQGAGGGGRALYEQAWAGGSGKVIVRYLIAPSQNA